MKVDGSDWKEKMSPEESESEVLFKRLLFYRQLANISAERLRIIKELERLLTEDHNKFVEYLSNNVQLYEAECEFTLDGISGIHYNSDIDPPTYVDNEGNIVDVNDFFYDKNTTMVQYLHTIKIFILEYLQELKLLVDNGHTEEITAKLKEAYNYDVSQIFNAKKIIENSFPLFELLIMQATSYSSDKKKNEILEKSLEKMRNDLKECGFIV